MTREERILRSKLSLLALAKELGNVSRACRIMGYSRDSFYRFKHLYERGGEAALQEFSRRRPNPKNRVSEEVERAVVEVALAQPNWGPVRASRELAQRGVKISPAGIRCVWVRHDLRTRRERLLAIRAKMVQDGLEPSEAQRDAFRREFGPQGADAATIESPGEWAIQARLEIGALRGLGDVVQHTLLDGYSKLAWACVARREDGDAAARLLRERVLPFYEKHGIALARIECAGSASGLADALDAAAADAAVSQPAHEEAPTADVRPEVRAASREEAGNEEGGRARSRAAETRALLERFHQSVLDELYRAAVRRRSYASLEELQADLDRWLDDYNARRDYPGRWCYGKPPLRAFQDALEGARGRRIAA